MSRLAVAAAATVLLAGCAGTDTEGSSGGGELGSGPGFDGETITIGVLNPTSGTIGAAAGQPILNGLEYRIERINAAGGIDGKYPIKLEIADTEYDPQVAIQAYTGMSGRVAMIGSVLGTGVVQALTPKFATDSVLAIPASNASSWVTEPNLLPTGPTYEVAFINGFSYLYGQPGGDAKKYCTYRQDDASGESYNEGIEHAAEELGAAIEENVTFSPTATEFTAQVQQLKSAGCDVVFYAAAASFAPGTISAAVQLDFAPTWMTLASGVPLFLMGSPSEEYIADNWLVSSTGAQWGDTSVPGMVELVEDAEKYGDPAAAPDAALWPVGYQYGMAIETILEQAIQDGDLSPAHLLDISHSSDFTIDFGGLTPPFTYGPADTRKPPTATSVFSIDPAIPGFLKTESSNVDSEAAQSF